MQDETGLKFFFWIGTAIIILSVLGIILTVVLYRNKIHKRNKMESDNLLKTALESEKRERKRIASDLHDGVSGDIMAVQNYIAILQKREENSFNKSVFSEIETALRKLHENMQNISYNLNPPMLDDFGLILTLQSYFSRIRKWHHVKIKEHYQSEDLPVSASDAYELYRIIQELITNMIKHGKPDTITFNLLKINDKYIFEIQDNGASFDFYKNLEFSDGLGLKNIKSRLKHIGAKLVQLPAKKGNKIHILLK